MQHFDTPKVWRILSAKPALTAFLVYYFFFLLVFFQFPFNGSLPGIADTVGCMGLMKDTGSRIASRFTGEQLGHPYYPEDGLQRYTEPYLGQTFLFLFYKIFGFSDLWAYYFFISSLYALNAFGMFLLVRYLTQSIPAGILSGFLFSASSYAFSNIELYNGISFFFCFICLYFFLRFLSSGQSRFLIFSYLFGGLEIYWSGYIFVYQTIILTLLVPFHYKDFFTNNKLLLKLVGYSWIYVLVISPYAHFFVLNGKIQSAYNPLAENLDWLEFFSLGLNDLINAFPHNLIYPSFETNNAGKAIRNSYFANLGITIYTLAAIGFFSKSKYRWGWLLIFAIGLVISLGPVLEIAGRRIDMPMKIIYEKTSIAMLFRIPGRAFSLCTIALSILAGFGVKYLWEKLGKFRLAIWIFIPLVLMENVPYKFHHYNSSFILNPPAEFIRFFQNIETKKVIAQLPSSLFSGNSTYHNELSEFSREYIYGYWQTFHGHSTINGTFSYLPQSRMNNNKWMTSLMDDSAALPCLIGKNNLDYIVYDKVMVMNQKEEQLEKYLLASPLLETAVESERVIIFKTKHGKDLPCK